MAAASIVIHQLGTTGTASIAQLATLCIATLTKGLSPMRMFLTRPLILCATAAIARTAARPGTAGREIPLEGKLAEGEKALE